MSVAKSFVRNIALPPKFYPWKRLNQLGFQVFRILIQRLCFLLKPWFVSSRASAVIKEIDQKGYCIINDFLSSQEFALVENEFKKTFDDVSNPEMKLRKTGENLIFEKIILSNKYESCNSIQEKVLKSKYIKEIIEGCAKRKIRVPPACIAQRLKLDDGTRKENVILHHSLDFDTETILHQDHCYPIYKVWLYINDISEDNGAFVFAPKSHRVTWSRLKYEYKKSVHISGDQSVNSMTDNFYNGRFVPSERERKEQNINEISLTGTKNTLIIANTVGFHRRGKLMSKQACRDLIHIDFRRLHSPLNLIPFLNNINKIEEIVSKNKRKEKSLN